MDMIQMFTPDGPVGLDNLAIDSMKDRTVLLGGVVRPMMGSMIIAQLNRLADISDEPITIMINSPGGCVSTMLNIIETMHHITPDVGVLVAGQASSAAAMISIHGAKGRRYITRNSQVMFHMPRGAFAATEESADNLMRMKELFEVEVSELSGQPLDVVKDNMRLEHFMGAEEAVEYGAFDKVLG